MEPDFSKVPQSAGMRLESLLDEGLAHHRAGDLGRAGEKYAEALAHAPHHADALHLSGLVALQSGDPARAEALIGRALALNPRDPAAHFNYGCARGALGQFEAAVAAFDQCLARAPDHAEAHSSRGSAFWSLGRAQAALGSFDKALTLNPGSVDALIGRGLALRDLRQHAAALASTDTAIGLAPESATAHNNRGLILADMNRHNAALVAYDRAIALNPDFVEAHNNRGLALHKLGRLEESLAAYDAALARDPNRAEVHHHRGLVLTQMDQPAPALAALDRALAINPELPYVRGLRLHRKMQLCDWTVFESETAAICARIMRGERASASFPLQALVDSPALHRQAAAIWTNDRYPPNLVLGPLPKYAPHARIRIGYFSMDFRNHPVSALTAGLFEAHDRAAFEIFGFSYGIDTGDAMRRRLEGAFDHFIDVRMNTDTEIVARARAAELDIAVDLAGHTDDARTGIFALRAAPVQVNYLGYLGTMAADYIDYIIADDVVIPPANRIHFSEKIATLPSYQVNDSARTVADRVFTRAELGLPAAGFVFCCFNNTYKITPRTFDSWMRILNAVERSVLFLFSPHAMVAANLKREAAARGVEPARLVFGAHLPAPEYLARLRAADLFLDTLPYNAGTTASDALWVGLPVLTLMGEAPAGRMAASLLRAIDMPELVTQTAGEYEALAIALARDPARTKALKAKLERNRLSTALFDTRAFARSIEETYRQMHARSQAGLPPVDLSATSNDRHQSPRAT